MIPRRGRIIYIAYHFHPAREIGARRSTELVKDLRSAGFDLSVVSAFGNATDPIDYDGASDIRNLQIPTPKKWMLRSLARAKTAVASLLRPAPAAAAATFPASGPVATPMSAEPSGVSKGLIARIALMVDDCKLWSWRAARVASREASREKPKLVICSGPPMTQLIAAWWVSWRRGIPLVADMRDGWITGSDEDHSTDLLTRISLWFEAFVLKRSIAVIVTASGLAQLLVRRYPWLASRMHVVRNGFDGTPRPAATDTGHRLDILFTGEIYARRNPFGLLEAVEKLLQRPEVDPSRITLTFVGGCDYYRGRSLRAWLKGKRSETVVKILSPVPLAEARRMAQEATVLLNLAQGSPYTIPAKSYDYMAAGRELLLLAEADGDTGRLFNGVRGVLRVDPQEEKHIEDAMVDLYQRHVVQGLANVPTEADALEFSRQSQNKLFVQLIEKIASQLK